MARYLSWTARLLVVLWLVSAGRAAVATELKVGLSLEPGSLDPHLIWSPGNTQLNVQMFGTLTITDQDGKLMPNLAAKWEVADGKDWVFHLDPAMNFSDGSPVTAEDVIASLERAKTLPKGTYRGIFSEVTAFEAVNDRTVRIRCGNPSPTLPNYLSILAILPKKIASTAESKDFSSPATTVSAGPYQMQNYTPGDRITLVPNPHFPRKPSWSKLTLRFMPDSATRVAALLSGQVDMIDGVTPDDSNEIKRRGTYNVVSRPTARTVYMTFDLSRDVTPQVTALDGKPLAANPFKDIRVRQALTLAINRQAIIDRVLLGQGALMNQISAPTLGGYNPNIPPLPFDPQKAKAMLAEAGYPNGFALTVTCSSGRLVNDSRICQALGQMLERIGLKATIDVQPYSILVTKATCHCDRRPSFFMSTWSSAVVGETSMALNSVLHSYDKATANGVWNLGDFSSPPLDKQIDAAAIVMDNGIRFGLQEKAMAEAMKDYPVLPLHLQSLTLAARKGLVPVVYVNELTIADAVRQE